MVKGCLDISCKGQKTLNEVLKNFGMDVNNVHTHVGCLNGHHYKSIHCDVKVVKLRAAAIRKGTLAQILRERLGGFPNAQVLAFAQFAHQAEIDCGSQQNN